MHEIDRKPGSEPRGWLRRKALWVALAVLVAGLAFVLVWFQPQKLFIDETVNEDFPVALATRDRDITAVAAAPTSTAPNTAGTATSASPAPASSPSGGSPVASSTTVAAPAAEPVVVARGSFQSLEHDTVGTALLIAQADGSHVLRFEDLDTSNGPDLRVLLSPSAAAAEAYEEGSIELGGLKGNQGNQNYPIPAGTDTAAFRSAVIWCERFSVAFGIADLRAQ